MTRKAHRYLPADVREALQLELRALRAAYGGCLPTPLVEEFAQNYDISLRNVYRLAEEPRTADTPHRIAFAISDDHLVHIARAPNLFRAWQECCAAGICNVGYVQFTRACKAVEPAVLSGVRYGPTAMRRKQAFLLREAARRNEVWIIDHYEVPVFVHWPTYRNPVKPWQTTILDDAHRAVIGAIWWPKAPTAEQTVAAVAAAVRGFTLADGSFVGGSPAMLIMDQGSEMIGEEATSAYLSMRMDPQPAPATAAWVKGKLENFHHDVLDQAYGTFPGWTGGPKDYRGQQLIRTPTAQLLTRDEFRARAWELIARYNLEHSHSALGGAAPLVSWLADAAPVRQLDDALLRQHWLIEQRKVGGRGVQVHSRYYQEPHLGGEVGRVLEVRHVPDDETFVDVQLSTGDWVRAVPNPLPETMQSELLRRRAAQGQRVQRVYRAARQAAAVAHAAARRAPAMPQPAAATSAGSASSPAAAPSPSPPPATPAAPTTPQGGRRSRRSTNTAGGGPAQQQQQAPPPGAPSTPPTRMRPRRISRPDEGSTP